MWAIIKKEVRTYFLSPIGYVFVGLFLLMASLFFYSEVLVTGSTMFSNIFYSLSTILIMIVPLLTMRTFSEERKDGTEQLLLTAPRSVTSIVCRIFKAHQNKLTLKKAQLKLRKYRFLLKILCCINRSFNSSSINIYILYNFNVFRKSKYKNITCNSFWIYIIRSSTNIIWYVCFKYYRKSSNRSYCINSILCNNMDWNSLS